MPTHHRNIWLLVFLGFAALLAWAFGLRGTVSFGRSTASADAVVKPIPTLRVSAWDEPRNAADLLRALP